MGSSWMLWLVFASGLGTPLLGRSSVQDSAVAVSRRVVVSSDLPNAPHVEPRLALDPTNAKHLLIGAMLSRRDGGGDSECSPLVSFDAGFLVFDTMFVPAALQGYVTQLTAVG